MYGEVVMRLKIQFLYYKHLAVSSVCQKRKAAIELLLKKGADTNLQNKE